MKILNLYAGIWWNRKLWEWDITAVEFNPEIAKIYHDLYPNDSEYYQIELFLKI